MRHKGYIMKHTIVYVALAVGFSAVGYAASRTLTFDPPATIDELRVTAISQGYLIAVKACAIGTVDGSSEDMFDCYTVERVVPANDTRTLNIAAWGLAQWKHGRY